VSFEGGDAVTIQVKGSLPLRLKPGRDGHQTEWDDLLASIVGSKPQNEADWAADSTMTAILGRMATYSGQLVTWDEAVTSTLTYAPDRIAWDATPRSKAKPDGIYPCAMPGITKAF
jgi:myo-inositol 2-dehydrogenase/D-chiro-inositol 1-dehydrogenase